MSEAGFPAEKPKGVKKKTPSGLPTDLSLTEILNLAETHFEELAQKLNTEPGKLRSKLSLALERQKYAEEVKKNAAPPRYERDPNDALMHAAYEEVMRELEFLDGKHSEERIAIMKEKADALLKYKKDPKKDEEVALKSLRAARAFRRLYTTDAVSKFPRNTDQTGSAAPYAAAIAYLFEKLRGANIPMEREGIQGAIRVLEEMNEPEKRKQYEALHALYSAYRKEGGEVMNLASSEQHALLQLFGDARARARTGDSPYSKWARFSIDEIVEILAANLLVMRPYFLTSSSGISQDRPGWAEKFGVPGSEIGGQFGYNFQARRPRRYNDEGNHGN